jgi:hypothetical protein
MTEARQTTHEERHRALVERLAANLHPVRRLWPVPVRLGLWLVLEVALLAWVAGHTHNDFMSKLAGPRYLLEVALFAGSAILAALIAFRSAIPGRPVRISEPAIAVVLLAAGTALLMTQPLHTAYPLSQFIDMGRICAIETCLLAAVPWIGLWWAVRRGAPMRAWTTGLAIGAAAALFSFALMRLKCPNDERLHLLTWHLMPTILIVLLSTLAGALWLRLRPRAPGLR